MKGLFSEEERENPLFIFGFMELNDVIKGKFPIRDVRLLSYTMALGESK